MLAEAHEEGDMGREDAFQHRSYIPGLLWSSSSSHTPHVILPLMLPLPPPHPSPYNVGR